MSSRHAFDRRRVLGVGAAASLAIAALGLAGPTVHPAAATPKSSGPGTTCERPNGERVKPGDYEVIVVITYNNEGQEVGHERKKMICGEDGEWHTDGDWHMVDEAVASVTVRWTGTRWRASGTKWHTSGVAG